MNIVMVIFVVLLARIPSSQPFRARESGFTLPIFHINHPRIRGQFMSPLAESPIEYSKDHPLYIVLFGVGEPWFNHSMAIFDTGSPFTWLSNVNYDPMFSASFQPLPFANRLCQTSIPRPWKPEYSYECMYEISYGSGLVSMGKVGLEKFKFFKAKEDGAEVDSTTVEMIFGSQVNNQELIKGILGVYPRVYGLLSALDTDRFSACFPRQDSQQSSVRFGRDARLLGESTPLLQQPGKFYFNVKSIGFGMKDVMVLDAIPGGEFIFDTGSSLTRLLPPLMDSLLERLKESVPATPVKFFNLYETCYRSSERAVNEVKITFDLDGGLIHIDKFHLWRRHVDDIGNSYKC